MAGAVPGAGVGKQTVRMGQDPGRARNPDVQDFVERDGVRVAYEVFGGGEETIVFVPVDPIVDSRCWKFQVPYLARRARVITIDPRGNGRSDQPADAAAYTDRQFELDTLAVMDAVGVSSAVLVGICSSAWVSLVVAAHHPERVRGVVSVAPWVPFVTPPHPWRVEYDYDAELDTEEGWAKHNRHYLQRDWQGFLEFFFGEVVSEPHSSKLWEDCVSWGLQSSPEVDIATSAPGCVCVGSADETAALLAEVHCPALVINGDADRCQPASRADFLAAALGAEQVTLVGAGHLPMAREPVAVNLAIGSFLDRLGPAPARRRWPVPARRGGPRVLYLSSPIGLGHAQRDAAIAAELRQRAPGASIDWLAQHPVTAVLEERGEHVHPASAWLANESAHVEHEAGEHDLHAFQAIRRMDEILVNNFMVFDEVVREGHYDLVVGDEAWDVDYFLHENPELKRFSFAWLTDFVGWLPMPEGGGREAALTADYNAEMLEQRARLRRVRDRSIFVGNPEDIVDDDFGPGLPRIRDWTRANFDFSGYVTGFDPATLRGTDGLRRRLGVSDDEQLCLVTVGGSGVGGSLLRRVLDAVPLARDEVPALRFVFVTGPRIDPSSLPDVPGARVLGYLPDLYTHLAACDLAVVQGGLTTCMELTALGKPFVYVPLRRHFEQNFHVRKRLDRYEAGRCAAYEEVADPAALAEIIVKELGRETAYRPVETDGAARAAALLAELL
jgi:pimeloyl-ACP methyl ester carboxylesterase/predicted glycosyltransferase